jgi:putative transposase
VLIQLKTAWSSYFKALAAWRADPTKFLGRPRLPKYKPKTDRRNLLVYEYGAVQRRWLRRGLLKVSSLPCIAQVRIVPRPGHDVVEIVHITQIQPPEDLDPALVAGIDLNLDNLVALASNKPGLQPILVNGRSLKSINQFYNKTWAERQSLLPAGQYQSAHLTAITNRRNRRAKDFLHKTSRLVVNRLLEAGIGTLVIGYNPGWK